MPRTDSPVRTTARDVLDPRHLRAAARIDPADATVAAALRAGAAAAIVLGAGAATGRHALAGTAALGVLTVLYGRFEPYRRRAALLAAVGALFTAAFLLTTCLTAAGAPTAATFGAVAVVAAVATVACLLLRTGPPGATIVVFAAAGGVAGPLEWPDVGPRAAAFVAGVAVAWLVGMSGYLVRPSAPARLAVRRAGDAVRRAADDGAAPDARAAARSAVAHARGVLADDLSHRRTRDTARVLAAELATIAGALDGPSDDPGRTGHATSPADALPARHRLRDTVRESARRAGWRLAGVRVVASGAVSGAIALATGLTHPAWAQMGATATLQGTTTHHAVVRAVQRGAGTAVGALLAWPLLAAHLPYAALCAVVVALQVGTEIVVGRHYGLAMLTITPMALLMTSLGATGDPAAMALARALDTLVGAALGVLAVVLIHPRRGPADD